MQAALSSDALTTASSPEAGRHYIAARAIKPGETVLCARPDVWAPLWPCELTLITAREINVMKADAGPSPPVGELSNEEDEEMRELIGSCSQAAGCWPCGRRCFLRTIRPW